MSKVDLPLWYYGYQVYRNRGYGRFSYCNANNILEESKMAYDLLSTDEALTDEEYYTITYSYTYNDEKYPVSQTISNSDQSPIKITY